MNVSDLAPSYDLVVIGGGPAGLAAASLAARAGVSTVLFDENPGVGGQIYRGITSTPVSDRAILGEDYWAGEALAADAKSSGASDELARAIAVNALVIGQIFYLLNSRYKLESSLSFQAHLGNPYLGLGIAAVVVAQALFTYAPPLQALFGTEAIPLYVWPWLFLGGLVFFLIVEAEKLIIRLVRSRGNPAPTAVTT